MIQRFDKEGISIPYPQQDVHYHNVAAAVPVIASVSNNPPASTKASIDAVPADTGDESEGS